MGIKELYQLFKNSSGVTTDTRKIGKGQLFFALKGEHFNGNLFAKQSIDKGASFAIIDEPIYSGQEFILVDNALTTLQLLAKYHREQFDIPLIAMTGSNGKTTTKELVAAVLEKRYKVHYTRGNLNNHIGIPLTLLEMPIDTEIAVIEMGANHQKEIAGYCKYTLPNFGLITNIGKAHLEGFGGIEGVLKGKTELYDFVGKNDGKLFVSDQSEVLIQKANELNNPSHNIYYGKSEKSFVVAKLIAGKDRLSFEWNELVIKTQLVGDYNFENALSAVCIGQYFGVEPTKIKLALEEYTPANNRSQMLQYNGNTYILDAYNANPSSLSVALTNFEVISAESKITIIGEMMELGEFALDEHRKIADQILAMDLSERIFVGEGFQFLQHENGIRFFAKTADLKEWIHQQTWKGKTILLKGSRKNGLEAILND